MTQENDQSAVLSSEYLINDPQDINSLKPGHVQESARCIDRGTRVDLLGILNGLLEVSKELSGTDVCDKLLDQIKAFIAIVSEGTQGVKL